MLEVTAKMKKKYLTRDCRLERAIRLVGIGVAAARGCYTRKLIDLRFAKRLFLRI